ncbi:MAG TPA: NUDIX hydrolase N-terminal domain-containing protein [Chloroflexia bacterium]|nr:NUDIX hydrolase N-terminal domain-containing protein [Chloroflexia bacterium]
MSNEYTERLLRIADELRAIAVNGLHWAQNDYDRARYDKALSLAADLLSLTDTRDASEIESIFRGDMGLRTPFVGVDAAIFNSERKILLVQRADTQTWCMPGGMAEVGESPAQVAEREVWEETGLHVETRRLVGVFDSHVTLGWPASPVHLYHVCFICERVGGNLTLTNETIAYGFFSEEEAASLALHRGHAFRIPCAFRVYRGETEAMFH